MVSLCNTPGTSSCTTGWPQDLPASAFQVLILMVCATIAWLKLEYFKNLINQHTLRIQLLFESAVFMH